jgi:glycosyltransferase involved in cell wall biosynthesis
MSNGISLGEWERIGCLERELSLYRLLVNRGWEVALFTYDGRDYPTIGKDILVCNQGWLSFLHGRTDFIYAMLLPFRWALVGYRLNIIMTNQAHAGWPAMLAKLIWRIPLVARSGYVLGEKGFKGLRANIRMLTEKLIYKVADVAIVPTDDLKQWVVNNYKIPSEKIKVIPNYVDMEVFYERPCPDGKENCVIMVGRLSKEKRIDLTIRAMKGINCTLILVGEGAEKKSLEKIGREENVPLRFVGSVRNKNLPDLLGKAMVFVCSSEKEGHPKALIEAMGYGMACLGTNSPGIKNIINSGVTGILVEGNVSSLREGIQKLLGNPELRKSVGKHAAEFVRHHYALEKIACQYEEVLSCWAGEG